ncbi:MAG: toll/interleukin-1 receptor domain-containing protein [Oscillospiraceae bacterium]|jgi:tetratricopeptide (TPR) repeat protein|nr:toll/interleukin-1 receptor domain-containing protein [Oscillospiraceae bacterium]
MTDTKTNSIFVSHAWVDDKPDDKVLQLVAELRNNSFYSTCDVILSDERTSIHFKQMMAENMQKAEKVIVVLSETYKEKADSFKGGVGEEYRYILDDIDVNENKYVLVTFEKREKVAPEMLRGREILELDNSISEELLHKLYGIPKYLLPDVSEKNPELKPKIITGFPKSGSPDSSPTPVKCIHNLPARNIYFTGRDDILSSIHTALEKVNSASLIQSVSGSGGIGKTQIVLEYAHRHIDTHSLIWWVNAETEQLVVNDYSSFLKRMGQPASLLDDSAAIIEKVCGILEEQDNWLLIFDNVDEGMNVQDYLPSAISGRVLLTSRISSCHIGKLIEVEVLEVEEAVNFLNNRIGEDKDFDRENAKKLADRLGRFPLALEQAAAYIAENKISYEKYEKLLDEIGTGIFNSDTYIKDYKYPVTATWHISIGKFKRTESVQLLNLLSYFAPDNIPFSWILRQKKFLAENLKNSFSNEFSANEILKPLVKYSLVKRDGDCLSIHRLFQEVIRDSLKAAGDDTYVACVLDIVYEEFRYKYDTAEERQSFTQNVPHAIAAADKASELLKDDEQLEKAARIYHEIGFGFYNLANYDEALRWYNKALAIKEKVFGTEHPDTAITYNNIAEVYRRKGDYDKALKWDNKALAIREKVLGTEHPDTAITYNNIALIYDSKGDYDEALKWHNKALLIKEKVLGTEHPSTATTYNNIAGVYESKGDYDEALKWHNKALEVKEKVLGTEHPDTAITYNNIGWVYDRKGDYDEALKWYNKAMPILEKVLGENHPHTKLVKRNIETLLEAQSPN